GPEVEIAGGEPCFQITPASRRKLEDECALAHAGDCRMDPCLLKVRVAASSHPPRTALVCTSWDGLGDRGGGSQHALPSRAMSDVFDTGILPGELDPARPRPIETPWGSFSLFVAAGRSGARVRCVQSFCPHLGGPLFQGTV